jgi:hypothetical protein
MQSIEIDPELNRLALVEAAQQYPETAVARIRVATGVEGSATTRATSVGVSKHGNPSVQKAGENP